MVTPARWLMLWSLNKSLYQSFVGYTQDGYLPEAVRLMYSTLYLGTPALERPIMAWLYIFMYVIGSTTSISFVGRLTTTSYRAVVYTLPSSPFLVVTRITPFAPRAPYMAVADASFSTLNDSMSSTTKRESSSLEDSTPSIKISGSELALDWKEVIPRM